MICIVLGHLGHQTINRVVFTFHVPIFFLITGFFFKREDNWDIFLKKKAKTLLLPYCTTSLAMAVLAAVNDALVFHGRNPMNIFLQWILAALYGVGDATPRLWDVWQIGALWFLLATFWGNVFLRLVSNLKFYLKIILVAGFYFAGTLTRHIWYPLSIQAGCTALLFMFIGYEFRANWDKLSSVSLEFRAALFVFSCFVAKWFISNFQTFYLVHADLGRGAIDITACLLVCYAVFMISGLIDSYLPVAAKPLSFLGKYSILVLCMHIIELNIFPWGMILDRLQAAGIAEQLRLYLLVGLKFLWIIPAVVICAKVNSLRRMFGLNALSKETGSEKQ